ncbi:hypothetical protein QJS10_CPB19g00547 [Acorus calamus]|uniref:Uncharacterized protein n=1 Tax=Acorus calamus TaxID=4465 RepID=A0AAV9CGW0_ACOCL|nr:hypothetical protein QJS10_CPB19g00547 [Acorus calamus]
MDPSLFDDPQCMLQSLEMAEEPDPPMALPMVDFSKGLPMKIRPYNPSVVNPKGEIERVLERDQVKGG